MGSTATADIARMLGSIHDRDHYTVLRDFFELSAISIRNAVDFGRDRETYEPTVKVPSRAQEKAPAEPEAPKPSLASEKPGNAPKCEKNGQFCLF